MGMICQVRQLSEAYAWKLVENPDSVLVYVDKAEDGRLPKEAQGEDLDLDKAWHGLHYLLTGTAWAGQEPACYLLKGGAQIGDEENHDVGYGPARILFPQQVVGFSQALKALTAVEIINRFHPKEMMTLNIYPAVWGREGQDAQDNYEYLLEYADKLDAFLGRAATQQQAVIIYLC